MNAFTHDELKGIVGALSKKPLSEKELSKVPLRPPRGYGKISKIALPPMPESAPQQPLQEKEDFSSLEVRLEAVFGKKNITLKQLENFNIGSTVPLEEGINDLVELYVNGERIARGELVMVDGHFGIRILSFTKN